MGITTTLTIAADHPAFAGHFPGTPILPGVVLLDAMLREIELAGTQPGSGWKIAAVKFHSPVAPGESLTLERDPLPDGSIRFAIHCPGRIVASGVLMSCLSSQESAGGE